MCSYKTEKRGGRIETFFATKIDATDIHLKVNKTLCVCLLSLFHWTMRNKSGESDGKSLRTGREGDVSVMGRAEVGSALVLQSLRQAGEVTVPGALLAGSSALTWWMARPLCKVKRDFHSTDGQSAVRLFHCKKKSHREKRMIYAGEKYFCSVISSTWPELCCQAFRALEKGRLCPKCWVSEGWVLRQLCAWKYIKNCLGAN